jgi:hypothetical protein
MDCCLPANNPYRVLRVCLPPAQTTLIPLDVCIRVLSYLSCLSSCLKYTDKNSALIPLDAVRSDAYPAGSLHSPPAHRIVQNPLSTEPKRLFRFLSGILCSNTRSTGPFFFPHGLCMSREQFPHRKTVIGVRGFGFLLSRVTHLSNPRSPMSSFSP